VGGYIPVGSSGGRLEVTCPLFEIIVERFSYHGAHASRLPFHLFFERQFLQRSELISVPIEPTTDKFVITGRPVWRSYDGFVARSGGRLVG
jgi:hypothetical protein